MGNALSVCAERRRAGRIGKRVRLMRSTPGLRTRLVVALLVGAGAAALVVIGALRFPTFASDFDQSWYAARALLHGGDPYALIGPGRAFHAEWPYFYPLMGPLLVLPFGLLPVLAARTLFAFVSCGLFALLATRDGLYRLPIFASGAFLSSVQLVQWTPIVACGILLPTLGVFAAAKPNVGMAVLAGLRTPRDGIRATIGIGLATVLAFVVNPHWLTEWRAELSTAYHFRSYVLLPGGFLLLLSLARWRRWEARLLAVLSLVPQTPGPNATLLLLLIPDTRKNLTLLSLLTFVPLFGAIRAARVPTFAEYADVVGRLTLYAVFLPTLWIVLRRPNVGRMPELLERLVRPLPTWLRGQAAP